MLTFQIIGTQTLNIQRTRTRRTTPGSGVAGNQNRTQPESNKTTSALSSTLNLITNSSRDSERLMKFAFGLCAMKWKFQLHDDGNHENAFCIESYVLPGKC